MKQSEKAKNAALLKKLLKENANTGARFDIGCGANKTPGFIGLDIRPLQGVDIVLDLEKFPWALPNECAQTLVANHVLEHIQRPKPDARIVALIKLLEKKGALKKDEVKEYIGDYDFECNFLRFMDECWRILKPGGEFLIRVPYAGSIGYYQDPTHVNPLTEATFYYFDPFHATQLYKIYRPMPWEIKNIFWDTWGIMEVLLIKRRADKSFMTHVPLTDGLNTPYLK